MKTVWFFVVQFGVKIFNFFPALKGELKINLHPLGTGQTN